MPSCLDRGFTTINIPSRGAITLDDQVPTCRNGSVFTETENDCSDLDPGTGQGVVLVQYYLAPHPTDRILAASTCGMARDPLFAADDPDTSIVVQSSKGMRPHLITEHATLVPAWVCFQERHGVKPSFSSETLAVRPVSNAQ